MLPGEKHFALHSKLQSDTFIQGVHAQTPHLAVLDPRGLAVGKCAFYRKDPLHRPDLRITRHTYNPCGRLIASQDSRLQTPNQSSVYSLSGQLVSTDSVDAGWRVTMRGEAGQLSAQKQEIFTIYSRGDSTT